jgi:hypothetical protein
MIDLHEGLEDSLLILGPDAGMPSGFSIISRSSARTSSGIRSARS